MEEKNTCAGNHEKHLCLISSTMTTYEHLNKVKALVRNPRYICRNCGRVAGCADNLCNPEPLNS